MHIIKKLVVSVCKQTDRPNSSNDSKSLLLFINIYL